VVLFSGIDKNSPETLKDRVNELIQVNKVYKAHVVSCIDPGNYMIEFPHVTEVLIKENLLPSGESNINEMLDHFFHLICPVLSPSSNVRMWHIWCNLKVAWIVCQGQNAVNGC
jgi:hypothetical protein